MRLAACLLVVLTLASCGDVGTAERLSSKESLDGIDVPTIGTVGDFPDPAHRHVVNVTADGRVVIDGATIPDAQIVPEIRRRGDATRGELILGTRPEKYLSGANVLLRVDGALPWGAALQLMVACYADGAFPRVWFAVRAEGDRSDGAFGFEGAMWACEDPADLAVKKIHIGPDGDETPATLFAALSQFPSSETGKLATRFEIDPRVPTRTALAMIDAAVRVGAVSVRLEFEGPDRCAEFSGYVACLRGEGGCGFRIDEKLPGGAPATRPMSPVTRRRGPALAPPPDFRVEASRRLPSAK